MFTIFGGATAFTQWQKDQKVTNPNMTAGDPVYFAASNGESYPTRAYISGGDVVADVPNELLTMHKPFTARLDDHDEPVTIFRVEAADKPSDYVYEDNMNKTHAPGDVVIPAGATLTLEEGAKVNDKAGVLATAGGASDIVILPETELQMVSDLGGQGGQYVLMSPFENVPTVGGSCRLMWGGVEYIVKAVKVSSDVAGADGVALGNTALFEVEGMENPNADAPFLIVLFPDGYVDGADGGSVTYAIMMSLGIVPEPPVISIVQVGAASGGGSASAGGGIFRVVFENGTPVGSGKEGVLMAFNFTSNIPGTDILSAFNDGGYVFFDFINPLGDGSTIRTPIISATDELISAGAIVNGVSLIALVGWDDAGTNATLEVYGPSNA